MMKKILLIPAFVIGIVVLFTSCEKDYQVYDGDLAAVCLDLKEFTNNVDSLVFSFALRPGITEDTIAVPLKILGFTAPVNRMVNIIADDGKTTAVQGEDFVMQPCWIPADSVNGTQEIVVRKNDKLETEDVCIVIKISDSPDLTVGPVNENQFRIILTARLVEPSDWVREFGDYSRVKHEFVIQVIGQGANYGEWSGDFTKLTYNMLLLNQALYEYNNAHPDKPLVDENGIPISFPG